MLLFFKLVKTAALDEVPVSYPTSSNARLSWLRRISKDLVDQVVNPTDADDIKVVAEAMEHDQDAQYVYPFCVCREGNPGVH